jgi:hypothetical protein
MDFQRGADAQQQVGTLAHRPRAKQSGRRQQLAEQHHVGLDRTAAALTARHALLVGGQTPARLLQRHAAAAGRARAAGDAAVHLNQLARAGLAVQRVDVLRDHAVEQAATF